MELFNGIGVYLILILLASFGVIGLVEGIKSVITAVKNKDKTWVYTAASFALSFVVALILGPVTGTIAFASTVNAALFGGVLIFAFIEIIGYNVIVKTLFAAFDALVRWIESLAPKAISVTTDFEGQPVTGISVDMLDGFHAGDTPAPKEE